MIVTSEQQQSPASQAPLTVAQWLAQWHSDGVQLGLAELTYYQAKLPLLRRSRRARRKLPQGALLSPHKGRGMEFDEVRQYQAGDDVRAIDWRVTARTGTPHTKLYREEQERPVWLVVDLAPSMYFGSELLFKSVQAAHTAAALAWLAMNRGDRVGAMISNGFEHQEFKPQARHANVMRILQQLVQVHQQGLQHWQRQAGSADGLRQNLTRLRTLLKPGSEVYLISDYQRLDDSLLRELRALEQHARVTHLIIYDQFEQTLPSQLTSKMKLQGANRQAVIDFSSPEHHQRYRQQQQHYWQALTDTFSAHQLHWRAVSAGSALEQQWQDLGL